MASYTRALGKFLTLTRKDTGLEQLMANVRLARSGMSVEAGVMRGTHPAKTEGGEDLTNAQLALMMEYGTKNAPARPFMQISFTKHRAEYETLLAKLGKDLAEGDPRFERVLGIIGAKMASDMKRTITDGAGVPPPNAESTIAQKGSSRPLVDTGALIGSIEWKVNK